MLNIIKNPQQSAWRELTQRPLEDNVYLSGTVKNILNRIRASGDKALIELTAQYDNVKVSQLALTAEEISNSATRVPETLKKAIDLAYENIVKFHTAQKPKDIQVETLPGVSCWLKYLPIETIGLYIPGGSAPLFSTVLMLAIPAQIAGSSVVYLSTPPEKDGSVHPAICYAAKKCGIKNIFRAGGAQAIAAMAYGTHTIPKADKICGPGNQYVTMAKQLVNMEGTAIDMPAGPSELAVFADSTANPAFIAADLLSQAEHGPDSQVLLVSTEEKLVVETNAALVSQLEALPRKETALKSLRNSKAILVSSEKEAFDLLNVYAPEHLIIASQMACNYIDMVRNAGSVFLGNLTPEAAGDYASGTNHTLPTNGTARSYSGITVQSFMKSVTFQELNEEGVKNIAETVETMAGFENLDAHRLAMKIRRDSL